MWYYLEENIKHDDQYSCNLAAAVTYIANSRTSLSCNTYYSISHYKRTTTTHMVSDMEVIDKILREPSVTFEMLELTGKLEYRIAVPTTLIVRAGYHLDSSEWPSKDNYRDNDHDSYIIDISIKHYLY